MSRYGLPKTNHLIIRSSLMSTLKPLQKQSSSLKLKTLKSLYCLPCTTVNRLVVNRLVINLPNRRILCRSTQKCNHHFFNHITALHRNRNSQDNHNILSHPLSHRHSQHSHSHRHRLCEMVDLPDTPSKPSTPTISDPRYPSGNETRGTCRQRTHQGSRFLGTRDG